MSTARTRDPARSAKRSRRRWWPSRRREAQALGGVWAEGVSDAAPTPSRFGSLEVALRPENIGYVGSTLWLVWATRAGWMNRRVDSVDFMDAETLRIHASIDFTLPIGLPPIGGPSPDREWFIVPLMILKKDKHIFHFDLVDEVGRTLSKLRAEDAASLGGEMLVSLLQVHPGATDLRARLATAWPTLEERLRYFGSLGSTDSEEKVRSELIKDFELSDQEDATLFGKESGRPTPFTGAVELAAENYLLCALVDGRVGESRVLKICYDVHDQREKGFMKFARRRLGWKPWPFTVPVTASGLKSYHSEVTVPDGVIIHKAVCIDASTGDQTTEGIEVRDNCAQMVVNHVPSDFDGSFEVELRAAHRGWLFEAMLSGFVIVGMLVFVYLAADRLTRPEDSAVHPPTDDVVLVGTVLLALAAALIALLARNEEHRLRSEMLAYCRGATSALVALAFGGVLVLVMASSSGVLRDWFEVFGILALVCSLLVAVAWVASRSPRRRPPIDKRVKSGSEEARDGQEAAKPQRQAAGDR